MPDDLVASLGLDVGSKKPYESGDGGGETGCSWDATGGIDSAFGVDIGTIDRDLDEYAANPSFTTTEVEVAGLRAVNFTTNPDQPECNLAVGYGGRSAVVAIVPNGLSYGRDKSCPDAVRIATAVAPLLPTG